jgi:hypothetical protein
MMFANLIFYFLFFFGYFLLTQGVFAELGQLNSLDDNNPISILIDAHKR